MAIPSVGGGYQFTDGNVNERTIGTQAAPQTATVTATLTAAQVTGGILIGTTVTTAASYTLPVAADLDAALPNAKVDSTFLLTIINLGTGAGVITVVTNTGLTTSGNLYVAITGSVAGVSGAGTFLFRKTDTAKWTVYRVS